MDVHDAHIPGDLFSAFTTHMPQCCVEVVVHVDDGVLLARRTHEPAKGEWFWPGSRLYKGEELTNAAKRVAREELGIDVRIRNCLGVYAHFWEESAVTGNPSRHTVNVVFEVEPTDPESTITLDDQHEAYRILTEPEDGLHEYVRQYVEDAELL